MERGGGVRRRTDRSILRVLVVEDEEPARQTMRSLVEAAPDLEWVGECWGAESPAAIRRTDPDLLLLDVRMPGMDGFEVLRALDAGFEPAVIFVTAYDDHAVQAFEVRALDYLLKPFTDERFREAVDRARDRLEPRDRPRPPRGLPPAPVDATGRGEPQTAFVRGGRLVIREGGRALVLSLTRIVWIEASGHYVVIHLEDGAEHLVRARLKALERTLRGRGFYRAHRSALVNLDAVREVRALSHGDATLRLVGNTEVRLSRSRRSGLEAALLEPDGVRP